MARLEQTFDATKVDPAMGGGSPVPAGFYKAMIVATSDWKPTKNKKGMFVAFDFQIIEGPMNKKVVVLRLNLKNPNQQTVEIAKKELSAICHAVGVTQLDETSQLHNRPLEINVSAEPRDDKPDKISNEIIGLYKPGTNQFDPSQVGELPAVKPAQAASAYQPPPQQASAYQPPPQQASAYQPPPQQAPAQQQQPAQAASDQQAPAQQQPQAYQPPAQQAPAQQQQPAQAASDQQAPAQQASDQQAPAQQQPQAYQPPAYQPPAQQQQPQAGLTNHAGVNQPSTGTPALAVNMPPPYAPPQGGQQGGQGGWKAPTQQ